MLSNEEKIRAEKKYSVESIYQALQQAFSKYKFNQMQDADGTMSFTGNGNPRETAVSGCMTGVGSLFYGTSNCTVYLNLRDES